MGGSYSATSLSRISTAKKHGNSDCALAGNIPWLRAPGGIDLRNLFADYIRKLPIDLRTYLLPFIYGLFGGLAAVAFQKGASTVRLSSFGDVAPHGDCLATGCGDGGDNSVRASLAGSVVHDYGCSFCGE
jgi:hypothetical protein